MVTSTVAFERATELDTTATQQVQSEKQVESMAHPRVSRLVQLWAGERRYQHRRCAYKLRLGARRRETGQRARDARTAAGSDSDTAVSISQGLGRWRWK